MRLKHTFGAAALAALLIPATAAVPARADVIQNSTGLASPTATITFDEDVLATHTAVNNTYAPLGVTFSSNLVFYDPEPGVNTASLVGNWVGNFEWPTSLPNSAFSIFFTSDVTAAAFALSTNAGATTTFTAKLDGATVASFAAPTDLALHTPAFFGFSGLTFNQIDVGVSGANPVNAAGIDEIQFLVLPKDASGNVALNGNGATVPLPAGVWTGALTAAGSLLGAIRARRKV